MKIKTATAVILTSVVFSGLVHAENPGFYVGGGLGYSRLANFSDASKISNNGNGGNGGTLFIGYNINANFGIEAGYRLYEKTTYQVEGYDDFTFDYSLHSFTLVAKSYIPMSSKIPLNIYILGGLAEVYGKADLKVYSNKVASFLHNDLVPTIGVGTSYIISPNFTTSFEYSYTGGKSANSDHIIGIPQSNLVTLNIIYNYS